LEIVQCDRFYLNIADQIDRSENNQTGAKLPQWVDTQEGYSCRTGGRDNRYQANPGQQPPGDETTQIDT